MSTAHPDKIALEAINGFTWAVEESAHVAGGFYLGQPSPGCSQFSRADSIALRDFLTKIIDASTPRLPEAVGSRIRITDTDPLVRGKDAVFEATLMIDPRGTTPERKVFVITSVDGKPADSFLTFQAPSPSEPRPGWAFREDTEYRWEVLYDAGAENDAG